MLLNIVFHHAVVIFVFNKHYFEMLTMNRKLYSLIINIMHAILNS